MLSPLTRSRSPFGGVGGVGGPPPAKITAVRADGWTATWPTVATDYPGTGLEISDAETLSVTRSGFDATGAATTVTDTVAVTKRLREPWPTQTNQTTDTVVLAQTVYAGDSLPGGITNSSTQTYPAPLCAWVTHDFFPITGTTFTVRLKVQHKFARNGRPVAAVDFVAFDGTTSRTVRATSLTFNSWPATGLGTDLYEATFTSADFLLAPTAITINAIIYPWCGPSYNLSTQGNASGNLKNCPIQGYRVTPVYAYVSPTGNDGTGQASTDPVVAAAAPFATIVAAGTTATRGIRAVTLSGQGRDEVGGGVIRFEPGTYGLPDPGLGAQVLLSAALTFEATSPANKATTILTDNGTVKANPNVPRHTIIQNLTLQKTGAFSILRHYTSTPATLVLNNVTIDTNSTGALESWINRFARLWAINVNEINGGSGAFNRFAGTGKGVLLVGCAMGGTAVITAMASRMAVFNISDSPTLVPLGYGQGMFCDNVVSTASSGFMVDIAGAFLATAGVGYAFVGNVIERFGSTGGGITAWADGNTSTVRDFIFEANTLAWSSGAGGEQTRFNSLYSDVAGATGRKDMQMRFNVMSRCARKTDVFAAATAAIGNWPVAFGVDHAYNTLLEGSTAPDSTPIGGPGSWRFEVLYPGIQIGNGGGGALDPLWTNDASISGSGLGGGDYKPQAGSLLARIPAGMTITARDLFGTPIPTNGTAFVGAVQR